MIKLGQMVLKGVNWGYTMTGQKRSELGINLGQMVLKGVNWVHNDKNWGLKGVVHNRHNWNGLESQLGTQW